MPRVVEYSVVESTLLRDGLHCVYPNSGAFAFPRNVPQHVIAWVGPDDPTIRPEALQHLHPIDPPYERALTKMAHHVWTQLLPGVAWLMPKSHWAYELNFGNTAWMLPLLAELGINTALLAQLNNGTAIEFNLSEQAEFQRFLHALLSNLEGSDFILALPGRPAVCTVHHHKQLWWVVAEAELHERIRSIAL